MATEIDPPHPAPHGTVPGARHIAGPRYDALAWQNWLAAQPLATVAVEQLLRADQRLVVVAPHPDDELLASALLVQAHARQGGAVLVVAVTDGEASHRGQPGWDAQALGAQRQQERTEGLACLQLADLAVARLGLPDGGVAAAEDLLRTALQAVLRPGDVVATTWRLDGHPDHEACGRAVLAAAGARGVPIPVLQAPVWMWHWARLGDASVPWHRLRALAAPADDLARKAQALQAHHSQRQPRGEGQPPVLDAAILARAAWPQEFYFVEEGEAHAAIAEGGAP